jgi:hypothetical protein
VLIKPLLIKLHVTNFLIQTPLMSSSAVPQVVRNVMNHLALQRPFNTTH